MTPDFLEKTIPAEPSIEAPPATPRLRRSIVVAILVAILFGIIALVALAHFVTGSIWSHLTGRTTTIDTSAPAVVERIRKLSRLETVVYSLDKIVQAQREYPLLPDFLTGDKLLLIAHGEVIAGIDLSQLQPSAITIRGDAVTLHLPAPQILTTRIDNQRTRVYSRTTGVLVPADPNLESVVRQAAEEQITQAAIDDGILDRARQNAQANITILLYGLGFHTVQVN